MKKSVSEDRIQADFFVWVWNFVQPLRQLCYHIPNGGQRNPREAVKLKAMGVTPGIPDMHIALPSGPWNSLYIEFKEPEANMNTEHVKNQLIVHERLKEAGNRVEICFSTLEAKNILIDYLMQDPQHKQWAKNIKI